MLRQAIPAVLITTTLALSACGGDSDANHVRGALSGYFARLTSDHPEAACDLLTSTAKAQLAQWNDSPTCDAGAAHVATVVSLIDGRDALRSVRVKGIVFSDEHRKAVIAADQIEVSEPLTKDDGVRPVVLVKRGGSWLIEDLGS